MKVSGLNPLEQKTVTMATVLRLLIIVSASRKVCRVIGSW